MSGGGGALTMAIDAGTGSCRAVLFDVDGRQVGLGQREWAHAEEPGVPGSQRFDTATNWGLICECVQDCLRSSGSEPAQVAAVASTSMREGIVLYDEAGAEIWACPNVDARASAEAGELIADGAAQRIYELAGDWVAITSPARLRWIEAHEPEVFSRIAGLGMLSDWIGFRLCGRQATDPSAGSSSGMFDLAARSWSAEIVELVHLRAEQLPPVLEPGSVLGEVGAEAAAQTGLAAGTPVVVGGADTQLALLGIDATGAGTPTVIGGTFWQHTCTLSEPLVDPEGRLRTLCHVLPDQWMIEGIGFWCGLTMRWFRDAFCAAEVERAGREGRDPYELMEELAASSPPGANGVIGVFSNLMQARHWVHASPGFLQFDVAGGAASARADCIRAIEESAAWVSRGHLQILEQLCQREFDGLVFGGGGAAGQLWPQVLADVTGLPVEVPVVKESTALGAAMCAGVGAGVWSSFEQIGERVRSFERRLEPDPGASAAYAELTEQWSGVYERCLEISESGLTRPLWKAAGA